MKTLMFIAISIFLTAGHVMGQQRVASFKAKTSTMKYGNFEIQILTSDFNQARGIATISNKRLKPGRNLIGRDVKTKRQLYIVVKKAGNKTTVTGFMIRTAAGKWSRFAKPSSGPVPGGFGCPNNWKSKLICYTHPVYEVTVCYTRCTPTELVFQLPSGC